MSHDCVLLVDDEMETVHLLRFALERAGYEVLAVERADDALRVAQAGTPDIVLLALEIGQHLKTRPAEHHSPAEHDNQQQRESEQRESEPHDERTERQSSEPHDGEGLRVCRSLRRDASTSHLPIMLVTGKLRHESDTVESFRAGADDYVMKPFRPAEVVARVGALLERARHGRDVSALSGLPGSASVENQLQRLIASGQPFGALYASLDSFKTYNEQHGAERGDEVLQAVAYCVGGAVAACCPDAFVGHTDGDADGDTFVVTTAPAHLDALAQEIMARFEQAMPAWYPPAVAARGSAAASDERREPAARREPHEQDKEAAHPLLSLSIAGASNEKREFRNPLEIAAVAAEIKKALRARPGSNYLKDRRTGRNREERVP